MSDAVARLNAALEGRYGIERELGEGGMATVYLADDLKHGRKVAIKVLKPELAAVVGAERFLAEIKTTANLQHPHILPLFDSGEAVSFLFYVMPYVEGESLRERLDREKQLGVDDALAITQKVAGALDYAHQNGVVHRDIKPGNILLSAQGEPLIADFGIALAVAQAGGERVTETGLSLGTPHYMSPEQATGDRDIGPRSDVYALACVLYEMLTGEPPYAGRSAQAVLAKILTEGPASPAKHRASVPANVDGSVRKALEKLPADRFTSAKEFAKGLEDRAFRYREPAGAGPSGGGASNWNRLSISMTGLASGLAVTLAVVLAWSMSRHQEPRQIVRSLVSFPDGLEFASQSGQTGIGLAISADGSSVVYKGRSQLLHRRLEDFSVEPIPGTEGASNPVFSPDGASVAFTTERGSLRTVSLLGGPPRTVLASGVRGGGLDWGSDGMLYFSDEAAAIQRVPVEGGNPELMTTHDTGIRHLWVDVLPEKRGFLFTIWRDGPAQSEIGVMDFGESEIRVLLPGGMARYAPSGHLVYAATDGTLLGAPFDLDRLEVTGPSVALGETVGG